MNKEGEECFLSIYPTRNVLLKTTNFNRFHCNKFIAMPNAHIRGCYCMVRDSQPRSQGLRYDCFYVGAIIAKALGTRLRDSDYRVFRLIFYKSSSCPCFNSILWFGFCDIPCIALDRTVLR